MTLAELILAHTQMGLGPHDEVLVAVRLPNDLLDVHRINSIHLGYLIVEPVTKEKK